MLGDTRLPEEFRVTLATVIDRDLFEQVPTLHFSQQTVLALIRFRSRSVLSIARLNFRGFKSYNNDSMITMASTSRLLVFLTQEVTLA